PAGGGLTEYIYGMYADMRAWGVHAFAYVGIFSITSDDADKGSIAADGPAHRDLDNFTVLPNNTMTTDLYRSHYSAISKCNLVLDVSDSLKQTIPEEEYLVARAEARFIRGYLYFNLVRAYGGVPKVTALLKDQGTFNLPRA